MKSLSKPACLFFLLLTACILANILIGCTVIPQTATNYQPSWDGTNQNSGLVGFLPDGRAIITQNARDRYNGLVAKYSTNFAPALKLDGLDTVPPGLTNINGIWVIDPQHLAYFARMNRWSKQIRP